jgi:hypothetical protein
MTSVPGPAPIGACADEQRLSHEYDMATSEYARFVTILGEYGATCSRAEYEATRQRARTYSLQQKQRGWR